MKTHHVVFVEKINTKMILTWNEIFNIWIVTNIYKLQANYKFLKDFSQL